ncbi:PIG-L deacetylase family protein [Methyloprofundus sp.]|uniref:PIG-L deacetylase family protein n=1 Tax=Methyloprofundus sp. TaxID=2020875 RepID=UPI003D0A2AD4
MDKDYQYAFQNSQHKSIQAQLKQGVVSFNSPQDWDTGFIGLDIYATFTGYFAEPYVEIINGQQRSILSFERGVQGKRYINLPSNTGNKNQTIQLIGHHLRIKDQQANMVLFSNPKIHKQTKVLLIAPHPDDAEIAAFGLYSQHNSLILTITAGEAGPHNYDEVYTDANQHYRTKGKLRVWDSITVPMLGGVSPEKAINLGYFDGTLQQMAKHKPQSVNSLYTGINNVNHFRQQNLSSLTPVTTGKANWTALLDDLKQMLQSYQPDIIVTPYPALDWHTDHKYSTVAVITAIKELGLQQGQLFLYTNHLTENNYFPYGQQGELVPIPPDLNQSLYFDSIYSYQLPKPKAKIFALEAMHDLRLDTSWLTIPGAFKTLWKTLGNKLLLKDQTYFRRAIRENELFLVVNFSSLYKTETLNSIRGKTK